MLSSLGLIYIINTILIITVLWLAYTIIKAGWLHNNTYYGQSEKQMELRWMIKKRLIVLVVLSLLAAVFNILLA